MSNSPLATYTRWSPNVTKPRRGIIRGVAIHCTAGGINWPARSFADMARFVKRDPEDGASCHYVVGGDGSIAQVCDEANRCQRNGIPRLLWEGEKELMGNWARQNMVVHRWTSNKECPGDYLFRMHGKIAAAVDERLAAAGKEEMDDVEINALLDEMTDAQAYALMEKAMRYAGTMLEPVWSRTDGYWAAAKDKGVMNGEGPERPVKRDELAAVLGRLGLLRE